MSGLSDANFMNLGMYSPEQLAQMKAAADTAAVFSKGEGARGLARGFLSTPSALSQAVGQVVEPFSQEAAEPFLGFAQGLRERAARIPRRYNGFDDVQNPVQFIDYLSGAVGEMTPDLIAAAPLGLYARGAKALSGLNPLTRTVLGESAGYLPIQTGRMSGTLHDDPAAMENTTAAERAALSTGYGLVSAPMQALPGALLTNRALGTGTVLKNAFEDGVMNAVKAGGKHLAKSVPEGIVTEGIPELADEFLQQQVHGVANPERDTSNDRAALKESLILGSLIGTGMSGAGRGADVAWSNARGLQKKVGEFLTTKPVPSHLETATDEELFQWDDKERASKGVQAENIAASMVNDPDESPALRQQAGEWLQRFKDGVAKFEDFEPIVKAREKFHETRDGMGEFITAAKEAYGDAFGKKNIEFNESDNVIHDFMLENMDHDNDMVNDPARSAELYGFLKQYIHNGGKLPVHYLGPVFGDTENLRSTLLKMHEMMVRSGEIEPRNDFANELSAQLSEGKARDLATAKFLSSNMRLEHGEEMTLRESRRTASMIQKLLRSNLSKEQASQFDSIMESRFGKNKDRVLEFFGAEKTNKDSVFEDTVDSDTISDEGESEGQETPEWKTIHEQENPVEFVGSGKEGGLWRIDHEKADTRTEIRQRMARTMRGLRNSGYEVRALNPEQYATQSGIKREEIAKQLGVPVADLASHPARMLMKTPKVDRDVSLDFTGEDIKALGKEKTGKAVMLKRDEDVGVEKGAKVQQIMGLKDPSEVRKQLRELGLGNVVQKVREGRYVTHNLDHSGEGRFTIVMKDGSKVTTSAQRLIQMVRDKRGDRAQNDTNPKVEDRPEGDAALLRDFSQGISSIMNNPEFDHISVKDLFGKEHNQEGIRKETRVRGEEGYKKADRIQTQKAHQAVVGRFGDWFKLMHRTGAVKVGKDGVVLPKRDHVTIGAANREQVQGGRGFDRERELKDSLDAAETLEKDIAEQTEVLSELEAKIDNLAVKNKDFSHLEEKYDEELAHLNDLHNEHEDLYTRINELEAEARKYNELDGNRLDPDNKEMDFSPKGTTREREEGLGKRDFQEETGQPLHPRGAKAEAKREQNVPFGEGVKRQKIGNGVSNKNFSPEMKFLKEQVTRIYELVEKNYSKALDVVLNYINRAARSLKNGNKRDSDELLKSAKLRLDTIAEKMQAELVKKAEAAQDKTALREEYRVLNELRKELGVGKEKIVVKHNAESEFIHNDLGKEGFAATHDSPIRHEGKSNRREHKGSGENDTHPNYVIYDDSRIETNYVQFSKEHPDRDAIISDTDVQAIKDYVEKTLGPNVATEFVKALRDPNTGVFTTGSAQWFRKNGTAFIQIVTNAANPMSKAHHESMHEFFQRLSESDPAAAKILSDAANSAPVRRQLEQFFANAKNRDQILNSIKNDPHEAVAYMFQVWASGKLKVGPRTESLFTRVVNFLRKALNMLSNDQKAEGIMSAFHDGKMSEPNAVAEVLNKLEPHKRLEQARAAAQKSLEFFYTAQNTLTDSGNPVLEKLGRQWSHEVGSKDKDPSYFEAKIRKTNQMGERLWDIIKDLDDKDMELALEGLQKHETSADPKIAKAQERLRTMLDQIGDYVIKNHVPLTKQKDYFPRAWSPDAILKHRDEFVKQLAKDYDTKYGSGGMDVAEAVATTLIQNRGAEPITETEGMTGFTPYMKAGNQRKIDWIKDGDYKKYMEKDLVTIMSTYIHHAVHRAEYAQRFGNHGEKIQEAFIEAMGHEVKKSVGDVAWNDAYKKAYEAHKEAAKKSKEAFHGIHYTDVRPFLTKEGKKAFDSAEPMLRKSKAAVMGMEGTLGRDIKETWRKLQSATITYENLRLLPLSMFANVIDPLGILVRGGELKDAYNAFKLGMVNIGHGWRDKQMSDSAFTLASKIGTIDPAALLTSQGQLYTPLYQGKFMDNLNRRLFKWNGVNSFSGGVRAAATQAAINFIERHATMSEKRSKDYIEELYGIGGNPVMKDGKLDWADESNQNAIIRWVDGAMLRPNAALRPSWASDPNYAIFFHLKNFTYAFQKIILERMGHEMKNGNYDPVITAFIAYVPLMIASSFIKGSVMNGGDQPNYKKAWGLDDWVSDGVQRSGLFGVGQFALDAAKWGPVNLAGPAVEQGYKAGKNIMNDRADKVFTDALPKTPSWKEAGKEVNTTLKEITQ